MPFFLARQHIPGTDIVVDPCAAIMVLIITGLLCGGIKEVDFYNNLIIILFLIYFWLKFLLSLGYWAKIQIFLCVQCCTPSVPFYNTRLPNTYIYMDKTILAYLCFNFFPYLHFYPQLMLIIFLSLLQGGSSFYSWIRGILGKKY